MSETTKPENQNMFSAKDKTAELTRRFADPRIVEMMRKPHPGDDRFHEYTPMPHEKVSVKRSDGTIDDGWTIDQLLSTPGNLTMVAIFKIVEIKGEPKRMEKAVTKDALAEVNMRDEEPEFTIDRIDGATDDEIRAEIEAHRSRYRI